MTELRIRFPWRTITGYHDGRPARCFFAMLRHEFVELWFGSERAHAMRGAALYGIGGPPPHPTGLPGLKGENWKTRDIDLYDADGTTLRATLHRDGTGLTLYDSDGTTQRVSLAHGDLHINDSDGVERAFVKDDGTGLSLYDSDHVGATEVKEREINLLDSTSAAVASLISTNDAGELSLGDGTVPGRVYSTPGGILFADADSTTRAQLLDDGSGLTLNDSDGNPVGSLSEATLAALGPLFTALASPVAYSEDPADIAALLVAVGLMSPDE